MFPPWQAGATSFLQQLLADKQLDLHPLALPQRQQTGGDVLGVSMVSAGLQGMDTGLLCAETGNWHSLGQGSSSTGFLTAPEEKCLSGCCRTLLGASAHPSIPAYHRAWHCFVRYRSQPAPHVFSNIIASTRLEGLYNP